MRPWTPGLRLPSECTVSSGGLALAWASLVASRSHDGNYIRENRVKSQLWSDTYSQATTLSVVLVFLARRKRLDFVFYLPLVGIFPDKSTFFFLSDCSLTTGCHGDRSGGAGFQTDHHKMETDFCPFSKKKKKCLWTNHSRVSVFSRSDCGRMSSSGSKFLIADSEVFHKTQNKCGQNYCSKFYIWAKTQHLQAS